MSLPALSHREPSESGHFMESTHLSPESKDVLHGAIMEFLVFLGSLIPTSGSRLPLLFLSTSPVSTSDSNISVWEQEVPVGLFCKQVGLPCPSFLPLFLRTPFLPPVPHSPQNRNQMHRHNTLQQQAGLLGSLKQRISSNCCHRSPNGVSWEPCGSSETGADKASLEHSADS